MAEERPARNLLVIDRNWYDIFGRHPTLENGDRVVVEQASWDDITLHACSSAGCVVELAGKGADSISYCQKNDRRFRPDFLLIRNNFNLSLYGQTYRNVLLGFMFADLPAINSLESILLASEKPIAYGRMMQIQKRLGGHDQFPLMPQKYYPNCRSSSRPLLEDSTFPLVVKIGTVHAGAGKMKITNDLDMHDFRECMMLHGTYFTTEPFLDLQYDIRLQKIGTSYRIYQRSSSTHWKGNSGQLKYVAVDGIEDRYRIWMDEVARMFGGLDVFALDVLKLKDGSEMICELNDTAIGLMYDFEQEDNERIRDLTLEKMNEIWTE